jgi:hypothetical protein
VSVAVRAPGIRTMGETAMARPRTMTHAAAVAGSGGARCVTPAARMGRALARMERVSLVRASSAEVLGTTGWVPVSEILYTLE